MKRTIRRKVFETNSSSTHSITICTKEEYDKWIEGILVLDTWDYMLKEEKDCKHPSWCITHEKYFKEEDEDYYDDDDEYYETKYTSPSGDELIIFGKYGSNR